MNSKKLSIAGITIFAMSTQLLFANTPLSVFSNTAPKQECVAISMSLSKGSRDKTTGGQVSKLQNFLMSSKYLASGPLGYFGNDTKNAVMAFQKNNTITSNGIIGPLTRSAIAKVSGCNSLSPKQGMNTSVQDSAPATVSTKVLTPTLVQATTSTPAPTIAPVTQAISVATDPAPVVPTTRATGVISADPSPCLIEVGMSTCASHINYSITGANTPRLTDSTNTTLKTQMNGTIFMSVSTTGSTFSIRDGDIIIKSIVVKAACATGSVWDGSICSLSGGVPVSSVVNFNVSPLQGQTPLTVRFSSTGGNVIDFGEGVQQTCSGDCPATSHTYVQPGVYTARLLNGTTALENRTVSVTVIDPSTLPSLEFYGPASSGVPRALSAKFFLNWTPKNVTSCIASAINSDNANVTEWSGSVASSGVNQKTLTPRKGATTYSLECFGSNAVSSGKKDIVVTAE